MSSHRREIAAAVVLGTLTALAYWGTLTFDFVNYDDPEYVANNPYVERGLTREGWVWAWHSTHGGNWHPLTWLSWQVDAQLGGMTPRAFHLTNTLLHAANAMLLFIALRALSGAFWRSAFVAGLFGLHPLHVESVAWIAERKDVLSTLFGMASLVAYAWYARRPSLWRLLLVALGMIMSLLSKPMLVTLPCLFLLIDFWPLGRWQAAETRKEKGKNDARRAGAVTTHHSPLSLGESRRGEFTARRSLLRLLVEKLPLFALSAIFCAAALHAQASTGAMLTSEHLPLGTRAANATVSYAAYLRKTVWPSDLAIPYPHLRDQFTAWHVAVSAAVLMSITLVAARTWRRMPYLMMGWLWYLGALVPVIGLVQVGDQALADRYTYVPLIGVFIAVVWRVAEWAENRRQQFPAAVMGCLALAACFALTRTQADVWRNSVTLWRHTLELMLNNATAHLNLAQALEPTDLAGAIDEYREVIRLRPDDPKGLVNLGAALQKNGDLDAAVDTFLAAVARFPDDLKGRLNLAQALEKQGKTAEAQEQFVEAVRRGPDVAGTHFGLGAFSSRMGKLEAAARELETAVRLDPADAAASTNLGVVLARLGRGQDALACFLRAVELQPRSAGHFHNLGVCYLDLYLVDDAIRSFRRAVELEPGAARHRHGLAAAQDRQRRTRP